MSPPNDMRMAWHRGRECGEHNVVEPIDQQRTIMKVQRRCYPPEAYSTRSRIVWAWSIAGSNQHGELHTLREAKVAAETAWFDMAKEIRDAAQGLNK